MDNFNIWQIMADNEPDLRFKKAYALWKEKGLAAVKKKYPDLAGRFETIEKKAAEEKGSG